VNVFLLQPGLPTLLQLISHNLLSHSAMSPLKTQSFVLSTGSTQPRHASGQSMHAIAWLGKKQLEYSEVPKPAITHPKDAIVRITATTICGSDLHLYSGEMLDMRSGDILGHEFMGVVEEVGDQVERVKPGMRVVVSFDIVDGTCDYCRRQEYTACDTTNDSELMEKMYGHRTSGMFGYSHLTGGYPGGQADYVRVPIADQNTLPLPDDVPDEKALYLSDIVPTAYHATEMAEVKEGDTVAIWGLGPVRLLAACWSQFRKASCIIGIDCVPERLELARKNIHGIKLIDFSTMDVLESLKEFAPNGPDASIDAAGFDYAKSTTHKVERTTGLETDSGDVLNEIIMATRKYGRVSLIAVYAGSTNHFPIGAFMEKGLTMRGSQCPVQKYWEFCLEKIRSGEFDPSFVLTHVGRLAEAPQFYAKMYEKKDGVVKTFLKP